CLSHDSPRCFAAVREIAGHLERVKADLLCCHGYKANFLGRMAARRVKIPVIAVARGWTGASFQVRMYERLDRWHLHFMDQVVCVSEAQATRVRCAGVRADRIHVICNAIDPARFLNPDPRYRGKLMRFFRQPRTHLIGAAGRLSPEKGFDVLVSAAESVLQLHPSAGFVLFGDGPQRKRLQKQIKAAGLAQHCILPGFRGDLDRFLPHFNLVVLPSHTEGMPNIVLEAFAAGVPVVATAVGGTPEVIEDGISGHLVPPGDADILAGRICEALDNSTALPEMGRRGRLCVQEKFGFAMQAKQYRSLFAQLRPDEMDADADRLEESVEATDSDVKPATMPAISLDDDLLATESTCNG
ncbi:MAG: glycosyltransferase, partial [Gemmataceae bacterium]